MTTKEYTSSLLCNKTDKLGNSEIWNSPRVLGKLTLPNLAPEYLQITYSEYHMEKEQVQSYENKSCVYPHSASSVFLAPLVSARQLTRGEDVKKVVEVCLDIEGSGFQYLPGDTIGVLPQNSADHVEKILNYLKLLDKADVAANISVKSGTLKKKACVPSHVPVKTTLRHLFQSCLDIQSTPKKIFLRVLAAYTEICDEQRKLEELCSKEGSSTYSQYVVETRTTLLDLFEAFPSCSPPVERLLEHLPCLQPRPYSIASSPLLGARLHFVYSLIEVSSCKRHGKPCLGVCTGWLDTQIHLCGSNSLEEKLRTLNLQDETQGTKIPIYLRKGTSFRIPINPSLPLILIGPGTGVAPFIGFLQHRLKLKKMSEGEIVGDTWLFFGCRYKERDFLYRSELNMFKQEGVLSRLFVSFSRERDNNSLIYVQDNIQLYGKEFVEQVMEQKAAIFVCGDAKNMGPAVEKTVTAVIQQHRRLQEDEAKQVVSKLKEEGRYLQDIWW